MKKWFTGAAMIVALTGFASLAGASTISFSSAVDADIHFDGAGNFTFDNLGTYDFDGSGGVLHGNISGTFAIGTVSGTNPQSAPVTGSGSFSIFDGTNTLTATISWVDIFTLGTGGGTNDVGNLNLTGISYSGTNTDLLGLKNATGGIAAVTFQFIPAESLTALKTTNITTTYSGTISAVPEPMTFSLMGAGLLGLGLLRKRVSRS